MTALFSDDSTVELSPDISTLTEAGILVIDEDPAFQLGLKTFLKEYVGFEKVFTARNGKDAIEMIENEESIELLTVDFQMPVMDGIEMLKQLQTSAPRPLGVTMITGFPSDELKKEFADLTSSRLLTNHFLAKPVEFEKLEPVILESYEDLKRSQMLTETMTGGEETAGGALTELNAMAIAASNRELMAKLDALEEKLDISSRAVRDLGRPGFFASFFTDIFKLLVAAAIGYFVWQSGVLNNLAGKVSSDRSAPIIAEPGSPELDEPMIKEEPVAIAKPVATPREPLIPGARLGDFQEPLPEAEADTSLQTE